MRSRVKVVSKPKPSRRNGPKPPPWPHKYLHKVGTVVEYEGVKWELVITGAADQMWKAWAEYEKLEASRRRIDRAAAAIGKW